MRKICLTHARTADCLRLRFFWMTDSCSVCACRWCTNAYSVGGHRVCTRHWTPLRRLRAVAWAVRWCRQCWPRSQALVVFGGAGCIDDDGIHHRAFGHQQVRGFVQRLLNYCHHPTACLINIMKIAARKSKNRVTSEPTGRRIINHKETLWFHGGFYRISHSGLTSNQDW